jgi:hypothetical protein
MCGKPANRLDDSAINIHVVNERSKRLRTARPDVNVFVSLDQILVDLVIHRINQRIHNCSWSSTTVLAWCLGQQNQADRE